MSRFIGFLIFFLIVTAIYGLAHFYVYKRFSSAFPEISDAALIAIRIALIFLVISFPLASTLGRVSHNFFIKTLYWISAIWMGIFFYIFLLTALSHGLSGLFHLTGFIAKDSNSNLIFMRICFFTTIALSVLASALGIRTAYQKPKTPTIEVAIKNLPKHLDGFRIVQLSDIHLGLIVEEKRLERMVEVANSLEPDIVVITGDLMDAEALNARCIIEPLKKLRTKYGTFAITGNHEFYAGVDEIVKRATEAGVKFLRNEGIKLLDGLVIYGIDDPDRRTAGLKPVRFEDIIKKDKKADVSILLYHRPEMIKKAAELEIDLMLCGHTHGGQLFPFSLLTSLAYMQDSGHFKYDDTHIYVTNGAGTWGPPIRFLIPPEIPLIILRQK